MKPLHKRNDLKFFIDTAVYCQQPAKHDELVRIIRDNYGSLEFSAHTADINLVHPGETDCDAFAHLPGILVNFRYIEDANRRRLRGCPRLPFTQHIIAKSISGVHPLQPSALDSRSPAVGGKTYKKRADIALCDSEDNDASDEDQSDIIAPPPVRRPSVRRASRTIEAQFEHPTPRATAVKPPAIHSQSDLSEWPAALQTGFPRPLGEIKCLRGRWKEEGRNWLRKALEYWDEQGETKLTHEVRGRWLAYASGGQIGPTVLSKQRDINLILGNITRRRSGGRRTHETLARAQNRAEKSGEEETAAELPRKRVKSEDGTPRPVSAVAPLASVSISANPTLHECNDNEKRSVSHDNSALSVRKKVKPWPTPQRQN